MAIDPSIQLGLVDILCLPLAASIRPGGTPGIPEYSGGWSSIWCAGTGATVNNNAGRILLGIGASSWTTVGRQIEKGRDVEGELRNKFDY